MEPHVELKHGEHEGGSRGEGVEHGATSTSNIDIVGMPTSATTTRAISCETFYACDNNVLENRESRCRRTRESEIIETDPNKSMHTPFHAHHTAGYTVARTHTPHVNTWAPTDRIFGVYHRHLCQSNTRKFTFYMPHYFARSFSLPPLLRFRSLALTLFFFYSEVMRRREHRRMKKRGGGSGRMKWRDMGMRETGTRFC